MSGHLTYSSKTSNTLFHYAPLPTTLSTLSHHAPLYSTTTIYHTIYHTTTLSHFTTTSVYSLIPASTSQFDSLLTSSTPTPSSTESRRPDPSTLPDSEILVPSVGLTIAVLAFLALLTGMTGIIWWTELYAGKTYQDPESQISGSSSRIRVSGPVGLGIMMHPVEEKKTELGYRERLRAWLVQLIRKVQVTDTMERWTSSAVSILRAELGIDAEEGLLLPVQENEKLGKGEYGTNFEVGPGQNASSIEKW